MFAIAKSSRKLTMLACVAGLAIALSPSDTEAASPAELKAGVDYPRAGHCSPVHAGDEGCEGYFTGQDLAAACGILHAHKQNETQAQERHALACQHFLNGLVSAAAATQSEGGQVTFGQIGAKGDESVCFELPSDLSIDTFATLVVEGAQSHPDWKTRSAMELAAQSLANRYPCVDGTGSGDLAEDVQSDPSAAQ